MSIACAGPTPHRYVYAKRWANLRTGNKGYAPACANEWVRGVCEKPRVKCGECPNQAFLPVTGGIEARATGHEPEHTPARMVVKDVT
jgi:hypothetical protein